MLSEVCDAFDGESEKLERDRGILLADRPDVVRRNEINRSRQSGDEYVFRFGRFEMEVQIAFANEVRRNVFVYNHPKQA